MMKRLVTCVMIVAFGLSAVAQAAPTGEISFQVQGGTLPSTGDYEWWYGCSPTSAGMMLGYYDRNGYVGDGYSNLVPGGVAEASTYPSAPGTWSSLAQHSIASPGHVTDFYQGAYGAAGDDQAASHTFDCLADFMGTSQDSIGNTNGSTTFYYYTNGAALSAADAALYGVATYDGMYGLGEYIEYAGYDYDSLYTQATDNLGLTYGFTFEDYTDEIDAGRSVMLHVTGHSMCGVGYDDFGNVLLYDTWGAGLHTMAWGGSYSGLGLWGVTALELAASGESIAAIPVPGAMLLSGIGAGFVGWLRRRRTL